MRAVRAGSKGYMLKNSPPRELIEAIEVLQSGETYFGRGISKALLEAELSGRTGKRDTAELAKLTIREREILGLVAQGLSSKEIAVRLHLSARTVETHRQNIMAKLDIHSAVGLLRFVESHF